MIDKNSIIVQKTKIDDEFSKYGCSNDVNGLQKATQYFEPMLTQFYEDLSLYLIEAKEQEKDKNVEFEDSVKWFYYRIVTKRNRGHLFKNFLVEY